MQFKIIDDAVVILRSRGVFRQCKMYERNGFIYAGHGAGFIRLSGFGCTSVPNISWDETNMEFSVGKFGYLTTASPLKVISARAA